MSMETRPFAYARLCHYADTPTGDFLVDYVPRYADGSVLVATGGSGHAFKFLPVLGEAVLRCVLGRRGEAERKWVWSKREEDGEEADLKEDWEWGTEDGSRSGEMGVWLQSELGDLEK